MSFLGEVEPRTCVFCEEEISPDTGSNMEQFITGQWAHRECGLRSVLGGIGHLMGHPYFCRQKKDPDAGLTYRQSAQMVVAWVNIVGIEGEVTT